jgi:hypothetical protein
MKLSARIIPAAAAFTIAALSGALVSVIAERAAVAAVVVPTASTDPQLAALLKYVKVDGAGNVTINGANVTILGSSNISITAAGSAQFKAGGTTSIVSGGSAQFSSGGQATIKGSVVTICCPAR